MNQDPLYRNQAEFERLVQLYGSIIGLWEKVYRDVDEMEVVASLDLLNKWYFYPAVEKIYGIKIRNDQDVDKFFAWYEERDREEQRASKAEKGRDWTLGAPDKEGDFWKWFNDPNTGKPVRVGLDEGKGRSSSDRKA